MQRPHPALLRKWYRKARAAGHRDIECYRDLNKIPASTLNGRHIQLPDLQVAGAAREEPADNDVLMAQGRSIGSSERYYIWSRIGECAHSLPESNAHKAFLLELIDIGRLSRPLLKRHGLNRAAARRIVVEFMAKFGLKFQRFLAKG
jgi:hypothetical protein